MGGGVGDRDGGVTSKCKFPLQEKKRQKAGRRENNYGDEYAGRLEFRCENYQAERGQGGMQGEKGEERAGMEE